MERPVYIFRVDRISGRSYLLFGGLLALCVLAAFVWSYMSNPGVRSELVAAVLHTYVPLCILFLVAGVLVWRLWVKLDK